MKDFQIMDGLEEIKNKLEGSQKILLVTKEKNLSLDILASFFSLFYTLKKLGKIVNLYPENIFENFPSLPFSFKTFKTFVLDIAETDGIISDLYYQKENDSLKIFITLGNGEIKKENVNIIPLIDKITEPDLIITLGIQNLEELGDFYEQNFKTFFATPILNIDNASFNQEFGQINWIETDRPLSEMVFNLITKIDQNIFDEIISSNLLAGIIDFYRKNNKGKEILRAITLIKQKGANIKKIISVFLKTNNKQELSFLEKVLERIKIEEKKRLPVVCLSSSLFPDLNHEKILLTIKMLRSNFLNFPSFLLLWEKHSSPVFVRGVFYYPNSTILQILANQLKGETNNKALLFKAKNADAKKIIETIVRHL